MDIKELVESRGGFEVYLDHQQNQDRLTDSSKKDYFSFRSTLMPLAHANCDQVGSRMHA
jgi:hypothetical protein